MESHPSPSQDIDETKKSLTSCLKPSTIRTMKEEHVLSFSSFNIIDDEKSAVSTLSKSTFQSSTSSLTWPTFLPDTEIKSDHYEEEKYDFVYDHSIIDEEEKKYNMTKSSKEENGGSSCENALYSMFLHMYDAIVDNETLQISCVDDSVNNRSSTDDLFIEEEEVVMKTFVTVPPLVEVMNNKKGKTEQQQQSRTTAFVSHEAGLNLKPIQRIPKYLTSTVMLKNSYQSSYLSTDESPSYSSSIIDHTNEDSQNDSSNLNKQIHKTDDVKGSVTSTSYETNLTITDPSLKQTSNDNNQSETQTTTTHIVADDISLQTNTLKEVEIVDEGVRFIDTSKMMGGTDNEIDRNRSFIDLTTPPTTRDVYLLHTIEGGQSVRKEESVNEHPFLLPTQNNRNVKNSYVSNSFPTTKLQSFQGVRKKKLFPKMSVKSDNDNDSDKRNGDTKIRIQTVKEKKRNSFPNLRKMKLFSRMSTKGDENNTRNVKMSTVKEKKRDNNGRGFHRHNHRQCNSPSSATIVTVRSSSGGSLYEDDNSSFIIYEDDNSSYSSIFDINRTKI